MKKKSQKLNFRTMKLSQKQIQFLALAIVLALPLFTFAQDAISTGLSSAGQKIKGYSDQVGTLILAIGGVIGLVGGIRVYTKWNNGDHEINKEVVGWAGSCVFLLLTGTILKAFFG